jgi:hypothetical protein
MKFVTSSLVLSFRFQDLRRDLQAVIGTRANFNIAQIENYGGETFLSEEVAIALLQESKLAFRRCELVGTMLGHLHNIYIVNLRFHVNCCNTEYSQDHVQSPHKTSDKPVHCFFDGIINVKKLECKCMWTEFM